MTRATEHRIRIRRPTPDAPCYHVELVWLYAYRHLPGTRPRVLSTLARARTLDTAARAAERWSQHYPVPLIVEGV